MAKNKKATLMQAATVCTAEYEDVARMLNDQKDIIIDAFCGAGGASCGIEQALEKPVTIALNHDENALKMHEMNHPSTVHFLEDAFTVDYEAAVASHNVALMWASPDCRSFSRAKGSAPRSKSVRMLPWSVWEHAKKIRPAVILMENVPEIMDWGELDENGVCPTENKGKEYNRFVSAMQELGYDFDCRILNAADYGVPTTRRRWYAIFRCDGRPIVWPAPTHAKFGADGLEPWLACGNYIDFSNLGTSIYNRSKPLADKTLKRISEGFRKYVLETDAPYIVTDPAAYEYVKDHCCGIQGGKLTSFLTTFYKSGCGRELTQPLPTITTSAAHFGLVTAFLVEYYGSSNAQSLTAPLPTITTKDRFGLVNVVVKINGKEWVVQDVFLRMLTVDEQRKCQGFPDSYILDRDTLGRPIPTKEKMKKVGNSVCPEMARLLCEANLPYLKKTSDEAYMSIDYSQAQLKFA